jgi:hypothetical protein
LPRPVGPAPRNASRWSEWSGRVGDRGFPIAGELFSPLKLLHLVMGPVNTTYFLTDHPERAKPDDRE